MSWRTLTLIGAVAAGLSCAPCAAAEAKPKAGQKADPGVKQILLVTITITNGKIGPGAKQKPAGADYSADAPAKTGTTGAPGTAAAAGATATPSAAATPQVTVQVSATGSTAPKGLDTIAKATTNKDSSPELSAECRVHGRIPTGNGAEKPITLKLLAGTVTSELLGSIEVTNRTTGQRITSLRVVPDMEKKTVKLTQSGDKKKVNWDDCDITYAFAITPWSVAKYELWSETVGQSCQPDPYKLTAWLDFGLLNDADAKESKTTPPQGASAASPDAGKQKPAAAAPAGAQVSGAAKASNFKTLLAVGAVYATGHGAAPAKDSAAPAKNPAAPAKNPAAPAKNPAAPPKPDLSAIIGVTLLDKDTAFTVTGRNFQEGANYMPQDDAEQPTVRLAKYRVVHLRPSYDWPSPERGASMWLDVTEDYLIVNRSPDRAMPGAPVEIYERKPDQGGPKFRGKIGRLAKYRDNQPPIRIDQSPVVAPFAQLVRVRVPLPPVQAIVTAKDAWTPNKMRTTTVAIETDGRNAGAFADPGGDQGKDPIQKILFLPCEALPRAHFQPTESSFVVLRGKDKLDVECQITQQKQSVKTDLQSSPSLDLFNRQLGDASDKIATQQADLRRLKNRFAEAQRATVGDMDEAKLYEIQTQIRTISDKIEMAQREHAAAEFQIFRIVTESEKK
jgi:hypothetical protein